MTTPTAHCRPGGRAGVPTVLLLLAVLLLAGLGAVAGQVVVALVLAAATATWLTLATTTGAGL